MVEGKPFDAVILAGGAATRMGGHDKSSLVRDGLTLLDKAIVACRGAGTTVCVGPERPTTHPVIWTREEPPGGGPVAGLAAGLTLVTAPTLVLLAADLPFVTPDVVAKLVDGCRPGGGTVVVDDEGRQQFLLGAYDTVVLRSALTTAEPAGASMRSLLSGVPLEEIRDERAAADVDTWADARTLLGD